MITDINSEDHFVQRTFADHSQNTLGWESVYAYNDEWNGIPGFSMHVPGRGRPGRPGYVNE